MVEITRRVFQGVCPHEYELSWIEIGRGVKTFECKYCGKIDEQ